MPDLRFGPDAPLNAVFRAGGPSRGRLSERWTPHASPAVLYNVAVGAHPMEVNRPRGGGGCGARVAALVLMLAATVFLAGGCDSNERSTVPADESVPIDLLPEVGERRNLLATSDGGVRAFLERREDREVLVLERGTVTLREIVGGVPLAFSPTNTDLIFAAYVNEGGLDALFALSVSSPSSAPRQITNVGLARTTERDFPVGYLPVPLEMDDIVWESPHVFTYQHPDTGGIRVTVP